MNRRVFSSVLLAMGLGTAWAQSAPDANLSALDIVKLATKVEQPDHWRGGLVLTHVAGDGSQKKREGSVAMQLSAKEQMPMRAFVFAAPVDIKGTAMLTHEHAEADDDIWLYLSSIGKPRRIVSSTKKNGFLGTLFTFSDLASPRPSDYTHVLLKRDNRDGKPCYVIESTPKDAAMVSSLGYSKVISWVQVDSFKVPYIQYHDLSGALLKEQLADQFVQAGDKKWIATRRVMRSAKTSEVSTMDLSNLDTRQVSDASVFNPSNLGSSYNY